MKNLIIKRFFYLFIILGQLVVLAGCLKTIPTDSSTNSQNTNKPMQTMYFNYFDTVSTIITYAGDTKEEFQKNCEEVAKILEEYHQLFDIYYEYSNIVNLCTINKNAGKEALVVDQKLIDFLIYTKEIYAKTNGKTNVMLGSVLKLWHNERTNGIENPSTAKLPDMALLQEANKYTTIDLLEIDDETNTVRIASEYASIDVGSIGKGYATEMAAKYLETNGLTSYVLNIGGNLRTIGYKTDGSSWKTGITNPLDKYTYAAYTEIADTSCVTSGDYERFYTVGGKKYHHIIDSNTLMPAEYFASITVITKDSGLADALSTALFCMSYEEGLELVNSFEGVNVLWIAKDGSQYKTDGFVTVER